MRILSSLAAVTSVLLAGGWAEAHMRLMDPIARFVQDDNGLKTGPCGSGSASNKVTPFPPGKVITVTWMESVPHAGHFRIALSANVADFVEPTSLTIPTTLAAWDLVDGIADKTGKMTYTQMVTLPNKECPKCVLQLLQVMSSGTDGTNTGPFSGIYHSCADLNISAAAADGGTDASGTGTGGGVGTGTGGNSGAGTGGTTGTGSSSGSSGGATPVGGSPGTGGAVVLGTGGAPSTGTGGLGTGGAPSNGTGGAPSSGTGGAVSAGTGGSAAGSGGAGAPIDNASPPACACGAAPGGGNASALFVALGGLLLSRRRRADKRSR